MIEGLHGFVRSLRRAGLAVSPAEWIDATRALDAVELGRRDRVRAALRSTLVKRRGDLETFDRAFDAWFAGPAAGGGEARGRRGGAGGAGRGARGEPPEEAAGRPAARRPREGRPPDRRAASRDPSRGSKASQEPREPREEPEEPEGAEREATAEEAAAACLRRLRRGGPAPERRIGRLRRVRLARDEEAADRPREGDPLRATLRRRMEPEEEAAIAAALPRLLARLRRRPARRLREARRGALYLRRLFRRNAAHGGVPFVLPRRRRKRRPPRVAVLLDVSWSVTRASALFLMLADELLRRLPDTRLLPFVDRPIDATSELSAWLAGGGLRGDVPFETLLDGLRDLHPGAASDYGRALHALAVAERRLGRRDWLVVLGDGRTNRFDPQPFALEELRDRIGGILWLVPEPVAEWGTGDSALAAYAPYVDVLVEAPDAAGLAAGVRELARATTRRSR